MTKKLLMTLMLAAGMAVAQSGSQTASFVPYASCLSVALPADGIHTRRARIPLAAIERCQALLVETARLLLES